MAVDVNTGLTLHDVAADELRHPASLTKMMTLYIVFGLLESGRLTLDSKVAISAQAAAQPPSKLNLAIGEEITVRDGIRALVTKSANDIAVALAERVSGSEVAFARLMTKTAGEIGMTRSVFRNASGLPDSDQVTTARDMLTLAVRLQDDYPQHFKLFSTRAFSFRGKLYRTHNTLLGQVEGVDGIKTGYIRSSGFNVVTSLKKDGKNVVAVVFGGRTAAARNAQMRSILGRVMDKAASTRSRSRRPMLVARPTPVARNPVLAARPQTAARSEQKQAAASARKAPVDSSRPLLADAVEVGRAEPEIAIARVRKVDVGAAQAIDRQPGYVPLDVKRIAAVQPARLRPTQLPQDESPDARRPGTLQDQLGQLLAASGSADAPEEPPPVKRIRQTQAAPVALKSPAAGAPSGGGSYQIQVGAFGSEGEARRQLEQIAQQAQALLAGYERQTPTFARGGSTFYRARFAGFQAGAASETCLELRRRSIDCFVTR